MNKTTKILLAVLIATLLGGGGYFYIKMAKKPVSPPINEGQKVEEIDTSNWQTYRNETLGFEIKYPPYLIPKNIEPGSETNEDWRLSGDVRFIFNSLGEDEITIAVEKGGKFEFGPGRDENQQTFSFINFPAVRGGGFGDLDNNAGKYYSEQIRIKKEQDIYVFSFRADDPGLGAKIAGWHAMFNTLKFVTQ